MVRIEDSKLMAKKANLNFNRFVELDRRFIDVTELNDNESSAYHSYLDNLFGEQGIG